MGAGSFGSEARRVQAFCTDHRANLDILRSIAVIFVLVDHLFLTLHQQFGVLSASEMPLPEALGHLGVLAFFVHTSLVLMMSLERMHHERESSIRFYVRRIFRIYPLAVTAVIAAVLFHVPVATWQTDGQRTRAIILANLLLVQNLFTKKEILSPLWSLPYEVQMYVVLPALYLISRMRRGALYLAVIFAGSCFFGAAVKFATGHLNMAAYVPCFMCGVLSYSAMRAVQRKLSSLMWVPFLLLLSGIFLWVNARQQDGPMYWTGWIFCLVLGFGINHFRDSRMGMLNAVAARIATYSYGIYVLHIPAFYVAFDVLRLSGPVARTCVALVLTGVLAFAGYHLVEHPLMILGKTLTSNAAVRRRKGLPIAIHEPNADDAELEHEVRECA